MFILTLGYKEALCCSLTQSLAVIGISGAFARIEYPQYCW